MENPLSAGEQEAAREAPSGSNRAPEDSEADEERERRLEGIAVAPDATPGYTSLEELLSGLLERIRSSLGVDTAAVLLLDEDRDVLVARAARGLEEEVRQGVQVPLAHGFAGRVAATGKPMIIEDLSRADVVNPILRQRGIRSMLGVPINVEGRVIGVVHVGTLQRREFDDGDVSFLQVAADRAALAIDNARLAEQLSATQIIQRTLLPDALPEVPGLRFSAKYLPAGSAIRIGGDWYDVFQLGNGRLTFVIGDVVGRGVLAASVMAEIRTALRAYLLEGHELGDVMSLLNDLLVSLGRNRTATAAIFEMDLERGSLDAVSAGHLPAVLVDADGEARFIEQLQGLPLGVMSSGEYVRQRYEFPTGSALLLYTDGLIERRGEPIDVGLERLRRAAERAAATEDSSFADRVYRTLITEAGLEDDVALLAIESLPLGSTLELTLEADPVVLTGLRRTLGRWLIGQGATAEELFSTTLAASEAAANAVEHAYGARHDSFSVRCERDGNDVRITIRDSGRWRERRPYGRGRGLAIIRAMVDVARVERTEEGTTVTLAKHLSQPAP
jgi:serine phosphatase RsbU (regulator of sigma subunit)/anti-sigma regulatory factor (Ser/Thr protein kinase)